jgi:hypothetical protein
MRLFVEEVESKFTKIFNVERANLVLVDRFKKDLFKYHVDAKTNEESIITYDL